MPYEAEYPNGTVELIECGHGDESFCNERGGCHDCGNCFCEDAEEFDE